MVVDDISVLNFYLSDASTYEGAINAEGSEGQIYVEIESGSTWKLTGDSYVTSLSSLAKRRPVLVSTSEVSISSFMIYPLALTVLVGLCELFCDSFHI